MSKERLFVARKGKGIPQSPMKIVPRVIAV
jgi:hypothetical protein